jgi:hypothetical protein
MADITTIPDVVNTAQAPTPNSARQLPPGSSDQNELTIALTPANASRPVILSGWQRRRVKGCGGAGSDLDAWSTSND